VTPAVRTILIATVLAYFLQITVGGIENLFVFVPQLVFSRPWTIVTYMFLHGGITHILFNMLGLYFFGPRVESRIGSRRFTTLYFLSGVAGALLWGRCSRSPSRSRGSRRTRRSSAPRAACSA
jgi:membrane associated rhomboid family serine protease